MRVEFDTILSDAKIKKFIRSEIDQFGASGGKSFLTQ